MNDSNIPDASASSPRTQARIVAEHSTAYNEITKPTSYIAMTHYFTSRWAAEIGGTGVMLILQLRALGFYNPNTGERREDITISLPELARRCAVSVPTLKRELANNVALQQFVSRQPQYRRDKTGSVYRTENAYHIRMDDPMHPSDEPALQAEIERREKAGIDGMAHFERGVKDEPKRTRGGARYVTDPVQNEPAPVQNEQSAYQIEPRGSQFEPPPVQNEPALIDYSYPPKTTQNTPITSEPAPPAPMHGGACIGDAPAPGQDFSFEERKEPGTVPPKPEPGALSQARKKLAKPWFKATHGRFAGPEDYEAEAWRIMAVSGTEEGCGA